MDLPSVTHPTTFEIDGMYFKVVSYVELSNDKAAKVVQQFYRGRKFKKKDKGTTFTVITILDENSAKIL